MKRKTVKTFYVWAQKRRIHFWFR